jgi:two-component system response regulator PilR (NtrC family)
MPAETLKTEPRVLIADDDQSIRQLLCTIVRRERLPVDCVSDGSHAIEMLKEREYSLILLDLMMPRVNGFGVIEYLRDHAPLQKPIVLVVTAYADQSFKDVDPDVVAGVLRKPFEVADLGTLIRACVEGFESLRQSIGSPSGRPAIQPVLKHQ